MAAGNFYSFEIPDWMGNDKSQEEMAEKVFCKIPNESRKRKKNGKKDEFVGTNDANGLNWKLPEDPNERLKFLLKKLQKKTRKVTDKKDRKLKTKEEKGASESKVASLAQEVKETEKPPRKKRKKKRKVVKNEDSIKVVDSMKQINEVTDTTLTKSLDRKSPKIVTHNNKRKSSLLEKGSKMNQEVNAEKIKEETLDSGDASVKHALNSSTGEKTSNKKDFKAKLQSKLSGAQFRWLNEQLYTRLSKDAYEMFSEDPALFDVYHHGFQSQVKSWPQNPNDIMIEYLSTRFSDKKCELSTGLTWLGLDFLRPAELLVADMGCGEAKIAQSVKQTVYSFDLVAQNTFVTACDMSKVPLGDEEVDLVIFCLSLMGKNTIDFLKEGNRILKQGGILKIAEVTSRFDSIENFVKDVCELGFKFVSKDCSNKMFVLMELEKVRKPKSKKHVDISLKPCIYKRR